MHDIRKFLNLIYPVRFKIIMNVNAIRTQMIQKFILLC